MSDYTPAISHAERAKRRGQIKAALREGQKASDVARASGYCVRYVREIAIQSGMGHASPGRPRLQINPEDMKHYVSLRRDYGAAIARQMIGLPL